MSLREYLATQRVAAVVQLHSPVFTAGRRARVLHRSGRIVAQAVLLNGPDGYFVVVLAAATRWSPKLVARLAGGPVRIATAEEAARIFTDCEWGVVSALGCRYGLETFLDEGIPSDAMVVLPGATCVEAVQMRCRDLEALTGAVRARMVRRLSER